MWNVVEVLPLVEFELEDDITDEEAEEFIAFDPAPQQPESDSMKFRETRTARIPFDFNLFLSSEKTAK